MFLIYPNILYADSNEISLIKGFIVSSSDKIIDLKYDCSKNIFIKNSELNISEKSGRPAYAIKIKNDIFVVKNNTLTKYDENFNKIKEKIYSYFGTITSDSKNIFLSADTSFICLSTDLNELSRVKYKVNSDAHKIMIFDDNAYIIGNFNHPMFAYVASIKNLDNISITDTYKFDNWNGYSFDQCLNVKNNQWLIFNSFSLELAKGQLIQLINIGTKNDKINTENFYYEKRYIESRRFPTEPIVINNPPSISDNKYVILSASHSDSQWLLIMDINNDAYIAKINYISEKFSLTEIKKINIKFDKSHYYDAFSNKNLLGKRMNVVKNKIVIILCDKNIIKIYNLDTMNEIGMIYLDNYNISNVSDLYVY